MRVSTRALLVTALIALPSCIVAPPDEIDVEDEGPPPEPECVYPTPTELQGVGSIMPPAAWTEAIDNAGVPTSLALEDVYCRRGRFNNDTASIFFILVAEWCPNCPDYARGVGQLIPKLEADNAMVVFVNLQTTNPPTLPTTAASQTYVNRYTFNGWRVGEADGVEPGTIHNSPIWSAVPGAFVVRTRDMQVIANQEDTQFILPFEDIAADPEADWSNPTP